MYYEYVYIYIISKSTRHLRPSSKDAARSSFFRKDSMPPSTSASPGDIRNKARPEPAFFHGQLTDMKQEKHITKKYNRQNDT